MAPIGEILVGVAIFGIAIAVVASIGVIKQRESLGRSAAQLAFVWLVPFIGPLIALQLQRKEPERGPGPSESESASLDDGDRINQRDATF